MRFAVSLGVLLLGVEYEMRLLPGPVEILVGEVVRIKNPRSGREMTAMVPDKFTRVKMLDYGTFVATRSVATARAYVLRPDAGLRVVVEKLLAHAIRSNGRGDHGAQGHRACRRPRVARPGPR